MVCAYAKKLLLRQHMCVCLTHFLWCTDKCTDRYKYFKWNTIKTIKIKKIRNFCGRKSHKIIFYVFHETSAAAVLLLSHFYMGIQFLPGVLRVFVLSNSLRGKIVNYGNWIFIKALNKWKNVDKSSKNFTKNHKNSLYVLLFHCKSMVFAQFFMSAPFLF